MALVLNQMEIRLSVETIAPTSSRSSNESASLSPFENRRTENSTVESAARAILHKIQSAKIQLTLLSRFHLQLQCSVTNSL